MIQNAARPPDRAPWAIENADYWSIDSEIVGDRYEIAVALPPGDPPSGGWPAIFLLDGETCFGTCVEAVRRMGRRIDATGVAPTAVVGIASKSHADARMRHRDYATPPPLAQSGRAGEGQAGEGQANRFLRFIEGELKPGLADKVALDADRMALFGHSLAGYFSLWALSRHPRCFRYYAAISPSIWWDRQGLEAALRASDLGGRRVFIAVGEWEGALPPWQIGQAGSAEALTRRESRRVIANAREIAEILARKSGDASVRFSLFDDEDHASIVTRAIPQMLRFMS